MLEVLFLRLHELIVSMPVTLEINIVVYVGSCVVTVNSYELHDVYDTLGPKPMIFNLMFYRDC